MNIDIPTIVFNAYLGISQYTITKNPTDFVPLNEVYDEFRPHTPMTKRAFINQLTKRGCKVQYKFVLGMKRKDAAIL